jgi:chromosomal replication initiator protein
VSSLWADCLSHLQSKISERDFNTWLRPLQASDTTEELTLYAQNQFMVSWVQDQYLNEIIGLARFLSKNENLKVSFQIGLKPVVPAVSAKDETAVPVAPKQNHGLNPSLTFESFVKGNSNQIAKSIAEQVAANPGGKNNNPYSIYGGTGLGKTHLMHAIGNEIIKQNPKAKVRYVTGERFMNDRGKAIYKKTIEEFKHYYRSLDVLMIDDIQFLAKFADKNQSSEEFLNTFNALIENGKQIVLVSDVYPQNIEGLDEKIKSRLTWGVNAAIQPPDLETRVAILIQKAAELNAVLSEEVAYFIGQKLRSDVRVLESAIKNLVPWANFIGSPITIDSARERLKDMFDSYDYLITIEKIQKIVAEYYNLKPSDLKAKSRTRTIARPRQIAMALAKELTSHSLPEIGREFGGRDHTTVMHACKTISALRDSDIQLQEDYTILTRKLSS